MPVLFLGFIFVFVSLMWLLWTLTLLLWPVALLIVGCVLLRGQMRNRQRFNSERPLRPSFNTAFEDYRQSTLRQLDEDRNHFREFVGRLRRSRDKEEFDRFISERRSRLAGPMDGQAPAL